MQNMYEAFLGDKNRIYYLAKFDRFDKQGLGLKASWNWPAFFFIGFWALYRKMYGWFFAYLGISMFLQISMKNGYPGLGALISIVSWIAFAILANSFYHNSVKKKIAVAQFTFKDESKLLEFLRYKGGVHTWVFWVSGLLFVICILTVIFFAIYSPQAKHARSAPRNNIDAELDEILKQPAAQRAPATSYSSEPGRDAYVQKIDALIGDGTPAIRRQTVEDPAFVTFLNLKDQGTGRIIRDIAEEADRKRDAARMAEIYKAFFLWKKNTFNQR